MRSATDDRCADCGPATPSPPQQSWGFVRSQSFRCQVSFLVRNALASKSATPSEAPLFRCQDVFLHHHQDSPGIEILLETRPSLGRRPVSAQLLEWAIASFSAAILRKMISSPPLNAENSFRTNHLDRLQEARSCARILRIVLCAGRRSALWRRWRGRRQVTRLGCSLGSRNAASTSRGEKDVTGP